ncbi:MAG: haloacid dehalogenase-like hydrolase [Dehalococcoidia bacterium]
MAIINVVFDFDGSLATTFVGGEMFRDHTPEDQVAKAHERFVTNKTSLREYQEEVFDLADESPSEMSKRAVETSSIRPLAHEICERVWNSGGKVSVASAGLDFYIQPVLNNAGLDRIEVHSGRVVSSATERPPFRYDYPSSEKTCKGDWVTCKCEVINRLKYDGDDEADSEVIFVGDGATSDSCAARNAADVVFATGRLLAYCRENGITATEFGDDLGPVLSYVVSKTSEDGAQ